MKNFTNYLQSCLESPLKLLFLVLVSQVLLWGILIYSVLSSTEAKTHGALALLQPDTSLAMQGQMIYQREGCQYCHTQNLRPFDWELKRFTDQEKIGYFPEVGPLEYYFETPYLRGSRRIGPDLSRVATRFDESSLRALLMSNDKNTVKGFLHPYLHLFVQENDFNPREQTWKVRWLLNMRIPFSSTYQRSAFQAEDDSLTKGDLLVGYLLSRGKKQMQFSGKYYRKD